uniref:CBS domain-containing protein n=1 Tax=Physcomitrium patens TaxID=3218 RepID=A0A2K1IF56_PHYPA|nr:hypothetical protein PHYPA_028502 [Physcomitrium patens]
MKSSVAWGTGSPVSRLQRSALERVRRVWSQLFRCSGSEVFEKPNFSLLNCEDLTKHHELALVKAMPDTILANVTTNGMYLAFPDQALEEANCNFTEISGIPVIDERHRCPGILSKKDDVPVFKLKNEIYRIPMVNDQEQQAVSVVTRTDTFFRIRSGRLSDLGAIVE